MRLHRRRIAAVVLTVGSMALAARWPRNEAITERPIAIVPLSAGVQDDTTLYVIGARRLDAAIALAERMDGVAIVTTNAGPSAERAQRRQLGRLVDRWTYVRDVVTNTRDEAVAVGRRLPAASHVVVVTSTFHTRRACAAFEHVGFRVTCQAVRTSPWYRLPYEFAYDVAAYAEYRLRGWV